MRRIAIIILGLTTAGLALVLSSCSSPISPLSASSAPNIVGLQQAGDAEMLGMLAPSTSYAPQGLSPQQLAKSGLQPQVSGLVCVTSFTWGVNNDNDLAPVSGSLTYGLCPTISGTTTTVSGTFTIADNNDNSAYSGFTASMNNFDLNEPSLPGSLTINGTLTVNRTATSPYPFYDITSQLDIGITLGSVSGTINMSGTPTFTSTVVTAGANPWVAGSFNFNGSTTFDTSNGFHYVLTRSGVGVYDTSTCVGAFTNGSDITYTDSQGNTLVIAYTGCGTGNWTFTPSSGSSSTGTF